MTSPRNSDESVEWEDDVGYTDISKILDRLELSENLSEQPSTYLELPKNEHQQNYP